MRMDRFSQKQLKYISRKMKKMGGVQMIRKDVHIKGLGTLSGDIDAGTVRVSGLGNASGNIICDHLLVEGVFNASNRIQTQTADIKGVLRTSADFSAEQIIVRGALVIEGLLNASNLDISFDRYGRVREISGETITIRPHDWKQRNQVGRTIDDVMDVFSKRHFSIDTIEGTTLYLEGVEAGRVRGEDVVVGPNCRIQSLEYTKSAKVHDTSFVSVLNGQKPL